MMKNIEDGTFNTYYTTFDKNCEYIATTNLYSMSGELSRVIDELEKI